MSRLHVGIFGPGDSGKTTLAKQLSLSMYQNGGFRSLVLDPNREDWGRHAFVTDNDEQFQKVFWAEKRCFCIIEEATETIARDNAKNSLFTRGRHRGHKICVSGHSGTNLLPIHRNQLHTLFLFRQPVSAAKIWMELFTDESIMQCVSLKQYEFLHCRLYQPTVKRILKLS